MGYRHHFWQAQTTWILLKDSSNAYKIVTTWSPTSTLLSALCLWANETSRGSHRRVLRSLYSKLVGEERSWGPYGFDQSRVLGLRCATCRGLSHYQYRDLEFRVLVELYERFQKSGPEHKPQVARVVTTLNVPESIYRDSHIVSDTSETHQGTHSSGWLVAASWPLFKKDAGR